MLYNRSDIDRLSPLAQGLLCYYPLNEPAGGAAKDALSTTTQTPVGTTAVRSAIGRVRSFNGTSEYIPVPVSLLNRTGPLALSFWVQTTLDVGRYLFSLSASTGGTDWFGVLLGDGVTGSLTSELISIARYVGGSATTNGGYVAGFTATNRNLLLDGAWHHIVLSSNGATWTLYLDGVPRPITNGFGTQNGILSTAGADFAALGVRRLSNAFAAYLSGSVGGFGFWNRALSADEVATLYSNPEALFVQAPQASRLWIPLSSGTTGSAGVADARDTAGGSGNIIIAGGASVADLRDTVAASGGAVAHGSATITDSRDAAAAAGRIVVYGAAILADAPDAAAASGGIIVRGSAEFNDGRDGVSGSGLIVIRGSAAATDGRDSAFGTGAGVFGTTGTAAITDVRDSGVGLGRIAVTGSAGALESRDATTASGRPVITGAASAAEGRDAAAGIGSVPAGSIGAASTIDARDGVAAIGRIVISGGLAANDSRDAASGGGGMIAIGSANISDVRDRAAGNPPAHIHLALSSGVRKPSILSSGVRHG